jgi:hypothetical protein
VLKKGGLMAEGEDKFVVLVDPAGVEKEVLDFADHVQRQLDAGWTRPVVKKTIDRITTTKDKE